MNLRKISVLFLFLVVLTSSSGILLFASAFESNGDTINYAKWKASNNQPYLYVEADNYYSLGYLEGENLAFQTAWMKLMIMLQAQEIGLSYDVAVYYALDYLEHIQDKYIMEMKGFADAIDIVPVSFMGQVYEISIDFFDILVQNCFWDIYYGKIVPALSGYPQSPLIVGGCTSIASKTRIKSVVGQNIDLTLLMYPSVSWVYTKISGKKLFSFRIGSMLAMGGINKWGLTITDNLIEVLNVGCIGKPLSIVYRSVLEDAKTVRQAKKIILDNEFTLGWNYIIRDIRSILAIETIPNSYSIERVRRGCYTFDANIYEHPIFKTLMIYSTKHVERYNKVSEMCEIYSQDGFLDIDDLFEIYQDPLISRRYVSLDPLGVGTAGSFFVDHKNNVYFCYGNPLDSPLGFLKSFD